MEPAYAAMFAALAGSLIGGLTSFSTVWFQQRAQHGERKTEADRLRREALYAEFIREASRLYGDAMTHEKDDVTDLAGLYAAVNQMRLFATPAVIESAERTIDDIVKTYLTANVPLHAMARFAEAGGMRPMNAFAAACRRELEAFA